MRPRHWKSAGISLAMLGCWASWAVGAVTPVTIFESATLFSHDTSGGTIVAYTYPKQFIGVRFAVTSSIIAQEIGGDFIRGRDFGNNQIYGALFRLSGSDDFPDSVMPINTPDLLAHGLITMPYPENDDAWCSIGSVTLTPGYYALLFGSNQFGATGEGQASNNNTPIGTPSYIFWNEGWHNYSNGTERYFVRGVPEVGSGVGILIGGVLMLLTRRHLHFG